MNVNMAFGHAFNHLHKLSYKHHVCPWFKICCCFTLAPPNVFDKSCLILLHIHFANFLSMMILYFFLGHGQHNLCLHWFDLCYFSWFKGDIFPQLRLDSILTFHFIFTLLFQKIYTSLMLNSFSSFHWCWTFGVKNNMGLVFSSWNLSSLCHVICVVIEDFNMSLELFVVLCIKMISNLLLWYARRLFNWILNWCCKFYHFQKIKMKDFFVNFFVMYLGNNIWYKWSL